MTPQSSFMVVAPIRLEKLAGLRELLGSMNAKPGQADPDNPLVPFGKFEAIHFARFAILDDQTAGDYAEYALPTPALPRALAFLGDIDGDYASFLRELVRVAAPGLRRIFSHCQDFEETTDLLLWMRSREHKPSTFYFNWRGRTVRQCREESALHRALAGRSEEIEGRPAVEAHGRLRAYVAGESKEGRLRLTPAAPTPAGWAVRNVLDFVTGTVGLLFAVPLFLGFALLLRGREKREPADRPPRPDPQWVARLAAIEDFGVTNQFSAMGSLKPGRLRRWTLILVLWMIDYTARHWYIAGRLARVHTIHCARWVFTDGRKRLYFASNYDGSLDSYMDDFINKVAFGLNVVFSNGIGYPRTNWFILDGAKDEQAFKYFIRRHQLPTEVWYNALPCLTNSDLERNSRIRRGIETESMTEQEAETWIALL